MSPPVTEITLRPGDLLYREGDSNECGYVIEYGEVQLYREIAGERQSVERRGAGSILGEFSILTGQPRTVSVEAIEPCKIYQVSSEHILKSYMSLEPMLRACVETSINFASTLVKRSVGQSSNSPRFRLQKADLSEFLRVLKMEAEMNSGLHAAQFSMHYQPIVSLSDGNPVGFEALMRWRHPELGYVSPEKFIPVAESLGSITNLTNFAITEACKTMGRVKASKVSSDEAYVSVNVSGYDLDRLDFVDYVLRCLDLNELGAPNLRIEVTESALIPQSSLTVSNLKRLQELGIGISIDDFGTGYSNLGYLGRLPLKSIKIDRSFVSDAHQNAISKSIVRMLVSLGAELGVDIIAEGLETDTNLAAMVECGCGFAQGFHFFRPLTSTQLCSLLAQPGNTKKCELDTKVS